MASGQEQNWTNGTVLIGQIKRDASRLAKDDIDVCL
jgi:hypothetical protein